MKNENEYEYAVEIFGPDDFDQAKHFYPKALNSQIHSLVNHFFHLDTERIVRRYCYLHPQVDIEYLRTILTSTNRHFFWGGADLFYVTTERGDRRMVVLETNSCPSGQKSMPPQSDSDEYRGYRQLIENSFLPALKRRKIPAGALAVIYDKNYTEASGYASTLSHLTGEKVYLAPCFNGDKNVTLFKDGVLYLTVEGEEIPIRAALRYVTQKPWKRIPLLTKTFIYNSTLACIAGGRNKLVADKAYELYNSELRGSGLVINLPETIKDVSKLEIPLWVQRFGGKAVVKIPYSNAGQGVFTIASPSELKQFMAGEYEYDQFVVQGLIGHYNWSSKSSGGKYFHVGTVPDKRYRSYIADLRMMIYSSPAGLRPCAIYARRASAPLEKEIPARSWEVLGTNLSIKLGENRWDSDTSRLLLMDRKDFNSLGIGIDDLIEGFIQSVLSVVAIDKMCQNLISSKGNFRSKLFRSLDRDEALFSEILF